MSAEITDDTLFYVYLVHSFVDNKTRAHIYCLLFIARLKARCHSFEIFISFGWLFKLWWPYCIDWRKYEMV